MSFPKKPLVFIASSALAVGVVIPGAMALSSGGERPTLPAQVMTDAAEHATEAEHAKVEAEHEAENEAAEHEAENEAAEHEAENEAAEHEAPPATNTNVPGANGDAHRSSVAAEHSQADEHRAVAPGQPANGVRDDDVGEVEHEGAEHEGAEQEDEENENANHGGDDGARRCGEDRSGSNSGRG